MNNYKAVGIGTGIIAIVFFILAAYINLQTTPNSNLSNSLFDCWIRGCLYTLMGFWFNARYKVIEATQLELPVDKCDDCQKDLKRTDERTLVSIDNEMFELCKECMIKRLDKQDGVCPQCKEPLKWNGNMKDFFGDWYHAKCLFELQQGHHIKETTKELLLRFVVLIATTLFLKV